MVPCPQCGAADDDAPPGGHRLPSVRQPGGERLPGETRPDTPDDHRRSPALAERDSEMDARM